MPWWGYLYILVLSLLTLAGVAEQFRTRQIVHGLATIISLVIFCTFVAAFFIPELAAVIGIWIVPMFILVSIYDWWLANLDLEPKSKFFLQKLPEVESRMNNLTALIILLPAYAAGIMVAYRFFANG